MAAGARSALRPSQGRRGFRSLGTRGLRVASAWTHRLTHRLLWQELLFFALIGTMIGSSEAVAAPPPSGMACCSQAWDAAQPRTAGERLSRRLRRNTLPGRAELGREPEATQLWLRRGEA